MTTSYSLMHKMRIVKCFHFHHTKAIAHRHSTILISVQLHKKFFLRSKMHAMREAMLPVLFSMTTPNSVMHKMRIVKRFHFHHTKAIAHRHSTILICVQLHKNFF